MRTNKAITLAVAAVIFGSGGVVRAQSSTVLFTTEADWAGSWAINSTPTTGTQSGWAGWGTSASTYVPPAVDGAAPTGQGTSNSTFANDPTETLSFNGPDLDGSNLNGLGNYDNNNNGTAAAPDDTVGVPGPGLGNYTDSSFVGYSNALTSPYFPGNTVPAVQSTSPGGSLTINNYAGGYDTITTGNMLQGGTAGGNANFIKALYGYNGSGILKVDFTSPLGGTTLATGPSGPNGSPYFLIGFLVYSNNPAFASQWVNPAPPSGIGPIEPFPPDYPPSYTVNHGTYWTGYIPYSGILPPADYTNAAFGIIVNAGDTQSAGNTPNVYAGTLTIDDIEVLSQPLGPTSTWALTGGGTWSAYGNWENNPIPPSGQGSTAVFGQLGAASTVSLDASVSSHNWTVGNINIDSPGAGYTFISHNTNVKGTYINSGLILDNGNQPAVIDDSGGTHTFNVPIQLNGLAAMNVVNAGDGLVFNNTISGTGELEVVGSGSATLNASNTYTGGINIFGGNLRVAAAGGLPSGTSLSIGNANSPSTLALGQGLGTFTLSKLALSNPTNSTVDVSNDSILVNYAAAGNPSPQSEVESALAQSVITSSDLPSGYAIGYADNGSSLLIERTLIGDTNLDGTVNLTDMLTLLNNYGQTGAVWSQGDFNYDGTVNLTDLLGLLNNYGQTASSSTFGSAQVVPEPACVSLAALITAGLMARRRVAV